jgi:hypothetical protein
VLLLLLVLPLPPPLLFLVLGLLHFVLLVLCKVLIFVVSLQILLGLPWLLRVSNAVALPLPLALL